MVCLHRKVQSTERNVSDSFSEVDPKQGRDPTMQKKTQKNESNSAKYVGKQKYRNGLSNECRAKRGTKEEGMRL